MIRNIVPASGFVAMSVAAVIGTWCVRASCGCGEPIPGPDRAAEPAGIWRARMRVRGAVVTTTLFAASLGLSVLAIVSSGAPDRVRPRPLPRYPDQASRPAPSLVLGEAHPGAHTALHQSHMVDDSAAWFLHRRHDFRRRRHG